MSNTPSAEAFDESLTALWDEIDLHTSLDNFKSAVKQLVDTHIIGKDEVTKKPSAIVIKRNKVNTDIYRFGTYENQVRNKLRNELRQTLYPTNNK